MTNVLLFIFFTSLFDKDSDINSNLWAFLDRCINKINFLPFFLDVKKNW